MNEKKIKLSIIFGVLAALFAGIFLFRSVIQITMVEGISMENTLNEGDYIAINKWAYLFKKPERFDVIVFPYKEKEDVFYIKRVIGLPGESVQIINDSIYINDELLYESYGKESMDEYTEGLANHPLLLDKDEYFVLGDNRNYSNDSRDKNVGLIKSSRIAGQAVLRIYPLGEIKSIR